MDACGHRYINYVLVWCKLSSNNRQEFNINRFLKILFTGKLIIFVSNKTTSGLRYNPQKFPEGIRVGILIHNKHKNVS